jgi:phosphomethylpyrimidine synthase
MRAKKELTFPNYYAKQGIITPEMEYIAIEKTNVLSNLTPKAAMQCQHQGHSWGANTLKAKLHQNLFVQKLLGRRHHTQQHQPSRE